MTTKGSGATRPDTKRVLIVDDHPMMREGLATRIEREPGLAICGEAGTAAEALALVLSERPDLVLVDITLPDKSGIELIKDILAVQPGTPMLALSMHDELVYAERVLRAGGRGYIMKQAGGKKIIEAIRAVLIGRVHVSEAISARILDTFSGGGRARSPVEKLTDREFDVFRRLGEGKSTREIAAELHVSPKTVEAHRLNLKKKLELKNAAAIVAFAATWTQSHPDR